MILTSNPLVIGEQAGVCLHRSVRCVVKEGLGEMLTLPVLLIPAMDRAQRQRPKGVVIGLTGAEGRDDMQRAYFGRLWR